MDEQKVFKKGFIPAPEKTPGEHTHARAKLIYNILRAMVYMSKHKREAALKELRELNHVIYGRVREYWLKLTPEQIAFYKGPRPHYHEDGTLAIYDMKGKDNPILMAVFAGESPQDASPIWRPGRPLATPRGVLEVGQAARS